VPRSPASTVGKPTSKDRSIPFAAAATGSLDPVPAASGFWRKIQ
jgi:hypothetical protein